MDPKRVESTTAMASPLSFVCLLFFLLSLSSSLDVASKEEAFLACLQAQSAVPRLAVLTPQNHSYAATLLSARHNERFNNGASSPALIVSPTDESHVQAAVVCGRRHGLRLRVRSGGHDFEGLSYRSALPQARFAMLDMAHLRSIDVDVEGKTAWVGTGSTIGELYHEIHVRSAVLGFPGAEWFTVGVGGLFGGGGAGFMIRKFGIAADHVVDARIVDVSGQVLDRESMGEDLFWAIRGGGAASFGVVLAYKIALVDIPPAVAVFHLTRTMDGDTARLISKWQRFATEVAEELYLYVVVIHPPGSSNIDVEFRGLYLGSRSALFALVHEGFPELGLDLGDCKEMSLTDAKLLLAHLDGWPLEEPIAKRRRQGIALKPKIDFVKEPISEEGIAKIVDWLAEHGLEGFMWRISFEPLRGKYDDVPEAATPYPHRNGTLYKIIHIVYWSRAEVARAEEILAWGRRFYEFLTPLVSSNPRLAYYNVRDLDLGRNREEGKAAYEEAAAWGRRYFNGNFRRLAVVKAAVDPDNYFWDEQSIPPLLSGCEHAEL